MIVVAHNLAAMNAQRQFNITDKKKAKNVEKLSSGYKINRSADDAAGLSISEKMRNQIRGLHQAMNNIEDGISFCKVGEGALNEVHAILGRIEELAVQAANDVNDDDDREAIDNEVQELKSEMQKIFRTTEFNGKKYWVQSYVPEVYGMPDDFLVFQSDTYDDLPADADKNGYGGVIVNGIRYSWDDLGATFDSNGYLNSADNGDGIKDYTNGEIFQWRTSPSEVDENGNIVVTRDAIPNIRRLYEWSAKDDGVYVNDVKAISKDDLLDNPLFTVNEGTYYGFDYHGMHVEFLVPTDEVGNWDDISAGINGKAADAFNSDATWEAFPITPNTTDSVKMRAHNIITISDGWKKDVTDRSDYYGLETFDNDGDGHADGFNLTDKGVVNNQHTKTKWEDFSDPGAPDLPSGESNGGFPIVDWGIEYNSPKSGNSVSDITLNGNAEYEYKDSITGFKMQFGMIDETSLENMEKEIANNNIVTSIQASVNTTISNSSAVVAGTTLTAATLSGGTTTMSFGLQRDSGKSFNNLSDTFNVDFGTNLSGTSDDAIKNTSSFNIHYSMSQKDSGKKMFDAKVYINGSYTNTITKSDLLNYAKTGRSIRLDFRVQSKSDLNNEYKNNMDYPDEEVYFNYTMNLNVNNVYSSDKYDNLVKDKYNAQQNDDDLVEKICQLEHEDWYETDDEGNVSLKSEYTTDRNNYSTYNYWKQIKNGSISGSALADSEKDILNSWGDTATEEADNEIYLAINKMINNAGLSVKQTSQPKQYTYINDSYTEGKATRLGVNVLQPKKQMYIQTGANSGEHQQIKWNVLSLNTIGMSTAETLTRESSSDTITAVQAAVKIVSRERSNFGAHQVRLERAYDNNANYAENLQNAESNIRDTDMAKEAMDLAKHGILQQAGQSMMAQANQQNQGILQLLQS